MASATTRVFLVRHGEVDARWIGRIYGSLDVPLSSRGREEAQQVSHMLMAEPLHAVISSGLQRTEYGAACLRASRDLDRVDDQDLRELDRGSWAGLAPDELERREPGSFEAWFRAPAMKRPPGGESLQDLLARAHPRVAHWAHESPGHSIAVVTHGWVIRVLLCHCLGLSLDLAPRFDVRTADVHLLEWTRRPNARPKLLGFALDRVPGSMTS